MRAKNKYAQQCNPENIRSGGAGSSSFTPPPSLSLTVVAARRILNPPRAKSQPRLPRAFALKSCTYIIAPSTLHALRRHRTRRKRGETRRERGENIEATRPPGSSRDGQCIEHETPHRCPALFAYRQHRPPAQPERRRSNAMQTPHTSTTTTGRLGATPVIWSPST